MAIEMPNFRIANEWGDQFVVHDRNLGEKVDGIYSGKKWTDVVLNGVCLDDTIYWDHEMEDIKYRVDESRHFSKNPKIIINERDVNRSIHESSSYHGKEKKEPNLFYRKKKVPQKNNKNYPTKPKVVGDEKIMKVSGKRGHFNWEITEAFHEDRDIGADMFAAYYDSKYFHDNTPSARDLYVY
jgi:hypothetical protein